MQEQYPKIALITGASRGLGKTLSVFLAQQGYKLILTARGKQLLETVATELREVTSVTAISGDVNTPAHQQKLNKAVQGGLDLLINNASSLGETPLPTLQNAELEQLEQTYQTNVVAPLALVQRLLPSLEKRGGMIINISSDAATGGYPGWGAYGASKAALDLITKTLANELRLFGVSAVAVDPGDMRTDMHQAAFPGEDITDRPTPEITLPFWAWLLGQAPQGISGERFQAQADTWRLPQAKVAKREVTA